MNWSLPTLPLIPLVFLGGIGVVIVASSDLPKRLFESPFARNLVWSLLLVIGIGVVALSCAALTDWALA